MKKGQSNRLTMQQKEGQGPVTIFHKDAQIHDAEVGNTSLFVKKQLEYEFPMLTFRYRKDLSKKEINERINWVADIVGLSEKLDTHPFDLTSTEKKFCTIGAVIMMDPKILIFDEPTCGQDVEGNSRLQRIIEELKSREKLCITISHDMKFVVRNFKRVIVMCKGKILLDGNAEDVFAQTELLKQSFVTPPPITRIAQGAGLKKTVFTTGAFIKIFEEERNC